MKTPHILLAVNAALAVLVAVPVMSAIRPPEDQAGPSWTLQERAGGPSDRLVLVDDDDEHEDRPWWAFLDDGRRRDRHHDDDDDEDHDHEDDDDDEDDDEDEGGATGVNPAPAGSVAPPANGLFGDGAPPQVQVN